MKKNKVLMAMSGGVDSSVAASLLVDQGYDVIGVTMQVWDYSNSEVQGNGTCCSSIDVDDARDVADKLNIPFYVLNCEKEFRIKVIDNFVSEYLEGKTPLPCVNCNTFLKFDHLFKKMKELDCDYLATGHYAEIIKLKNSKYGIKTSVDSFKDQTYFLFTLKDNLLEKMIFPIGHMNKLDVRTIALKKGLLNAKKKDSTGICFIGKKGYSTFIESIVDKKSISKGKIKLHPTGQVIGDHDGIHKFTYGQRKGVGISGFEKPLYVYKIKGTTVWLSEEEHLYSKTMTINNINLLDKINSEERLKVKIRYQHAGSWCRMKSLGDSAIVEFETPQRAVTPGQAAVFYRDKQLVGGGWIM